MLLFVSNAVLSQQAKNKEADWQPAMVYGGAPSCPEHSGTRYLYSDTISSHGRQLMVAGSATRNPLKVCSFTAELRITGKSIKTVSFSKSDSYDINIADFSPDGSTILLFSTLPLPDQIDDSRHPDYRDVRLSILELFHPEQRTWINAWDLFGWNNCDATVEPQGFTLDGKALILVRPSTWQSKTYKDCVNDWGLYATDLISKPVRLPDDTKVPRFGTLIKDSSSPCKTDPDVVGACFTFRGRMSLYNGCCMARIWQVGTHHLLAQEDEIPLPAILQDKINWDVDAWGDYEVCPMEPKRAGEMQMVCVQSVKNLLINPRK